MKTKIIITILLLLISLTTITKSQDNYPVQRTFTYCGTPGYIIDGNNEEFRQNNFTLGWMWGSLPTISTALFSNQHDSNCDDPYNIFTQGENLCIRSNDNCYQLYARHGEGTGYLCSRAMQFKPDLLIPTNIDYTTLANQCKNDPFPNASIFGFKFINDSAVRTGNSLNLLTSKFNGKELVLQNPWMIRKLDFGKGIYSIINLESSLIQCF
jgi:hypothetical protein